MPNNLTIHFGVLPENLAEVIPGVAGLETSTPGDSWHGWGIPIAQSEGYRDRAQRVQIHTDNAIALLPRVLTHYGSLLVPAQYEEDRFRNKALVLITNRYDQGQRNYVGCGGIYVGEQPVSSYIEDLNAAGQQPGDALAFA